MTVLTKLPSEAMYDALSFVSKRFIYEPDAKLNDKWSILGRGTWKGDCDDFALTLAYRLAGSSMLKLFWGVLTRRYKFMMCKTLRGQSHLYLEVDGWQACNIYRSWEEAGTRFAQEWRVPLPFVALKMLGTASVIALALFGLAVAYWPSIVRMLAGLGEG